MSEVNINIDFEQLKKSGLTPEDATRLLREGIFEAVDIIADLIVALAKQRARKDTWTMHRSIRKEIVSDTVISVVAGGDEYINPKTKRPCDYAPYQEAYNQFMSAPMEFVVANDLINMIQQKVEQKFAEAGIQLV